MLRRAAVACAALVAILTPTTAGAASPGAPYGLIAFSAGGVPGTTPAERAANYRRLYDAGVRAIRMDLGWTTVQPPGGGGGFRFAALDREVGAIRAAGLRLIGILGYGNRDYSAAGQLAARSPLSGGLPPFAIGNADYFPPDDPASYARYAAATAAHFAGDAIAFEVWNEENAGWRFWPPHEDPAAYARLLCTAYPALKRAAPGLPVLFGGVFFPGVAGLPAMSGPEFVGRAYAARPDLGRCYDVLAYHPYAYPFTAPELDVPVRGSVLSAADQLRAVLAQAGDAHKPLWITEVGWPTQAGYGVTPETQARYSARLAAATFAAGVPVLTFYTYGDSADPTGPVNQEARFGFFDPDNRAKPAYTALRTLTRQLSGASFVADRSSALGMPTGRPLTGDRGFALRYHRPGANVTVLWLASESVAAAQGPLPAGDRTLSITLPVRSRTVTVTDYLGHGRAVPTPGGRLTLDVGPGPVYVTDPERATRHRCRRPGHRRRGCLRRPRRALSAA